MKTIPKPISLLTVKNVRNNQDSIFMVPVDPGEATCRGSKPILFRCQDHPDEPGRSASIEKVLLTGNVPFKDHDTPAAPRDRLTLPLVPNRAQNGNQGSILAYSLFGQFLVTGLIGALLNPYFRIPGIRAWNQKSPILRGEKTALLFPFGWQIVVQMGWVRGKRKKGLF